MKTIIEILKGAIIGMANVVPGVSGGTIAVVMNIYDTLINAIAEIFTKPIKTLKSIWVYIVGVILGIGLSVTVISYLLDSYEIEVTSLFIGLIIGALPIVINHVNNKKIKPIDLILFSVMIFVVISLPYIGLLKTTTEVSTNGIMMLIVGIITAATMVIPGVSGSMILITIGYYDTITTLVSDVIKYFITFNIAELIPLVITLIPFGIGIILGIIIIAKVIKWLLEKYSKTVYWGILGLVVASPFAVIMNLDLSVANIKTTIISVLTFIIGYKIANMFCKIERRNK